MHDAIEALAIFVVLSLALWAVDGAAQDVTYCPSPTVQL